MKIVSVNVGLPREVVWKGMTVQTGIFKDPVGGRVTISKLNRTTSTIRLNPARGFVASCPYDSQEPPGQFADLVGLPMFDGSLWH
jgi:MOSC domain-containing protein YiiM